MDYAGTSRAELVKLAATGDRDAERELDRRAARLERFRRYLPIWGRR